MPERSDLRPTRHLVTVRRVLMDLRDAWRAPLPEPLLPPLRDYPVPQR
jgi:hypothetical protein